MSPRVKSARLRAVDDGDPDDKVDASDPATAALGSDVDNADGTPPAPDSLEAAYHDEVEKSLARAKQNEPGRDTTLIMLIVTAIIGVVVGFLVVMMI